QIQLAVLRLQVGLAGTLQRRLNFPLSRQQAKRERAASSNWRLIPRRPARPGWQESCVLSAGDSRLVLFSLSSSLLPLYLTQQFFCFRLQDRLIQSWRIDYAAELAHPKVRRGQLFFPLAHRSVQEIHVPCLPLCPERLLTPCRRAARRPNSKLVVCR